MSKSKIVLYVSLLLAILGSAYLISVGIRHFSGGDPIVRVTGLSERHITSDLIILPITITAQDQKQTEAYKTLQDSKAKAEQFLKASGLEPKEISISSTTLNEDRESEYIDGRYVTTFRGYKLSVTITIRSNRVNKVEEISSSISDLIASGVTVEAGSARYYYTKLNELKSEMLKEAAGDALNRARIIAEHGNSSLGKLKSSTMGVFQIVGAHEEEEYSWGGSFNTKSKEKTASVTVKASYKLN